MILGVGLLGYWEEKDEKKSDIWQKRVCGDHETREKVREIKRIFCFPSVELTGKKREIPVLESLFTELQAIEMTASSWTYCLLVMSLQSVPGLQIRWWISSLASLNCSQRSLGLSQLQPGLSGLSQLQPGVSGLSQLQPGLSASRCPFCSSYNLLISRIPGFRGWGGHQDSGCYRPCQVSSSLGFMWLMFFQHY